MSHAPRIHKADRHTWAVGCTCRFGTSGTVTAATEESAYAVWEDHAMSAEERPQGVSEALSAARGALR